jgi:histidinol-phosphate aminotransferase
VFADHGVVVRPFAGEGVRVTIGEPSSVDKLLHAAQQIVDLTSR